MTQAVAEVELLALIFEGSNEWTLQIAHNDLMETFLDNGFSSGRFVLSKVYQGEKRGTIAQVSALLKQCSCFKLFCQHCFGLHALTHRTQQQRTNAADFDEFMHTIFGARGTFGFSGTQQQRTQPGSASPGMFLTKKWKHSRH
jgi:hypothetical protein